MSVLTHNIDSYPYTGTRQVKGNLRLKNNDYIRKFFDGTAGFVQIKSVTVGKEYEVIGVEGFGDVEDVIFIDDVGEQQRLADFFWEET